MLRAEISSSTDVHKLKLEGRFVAGAAEDTRILMARAAIGVRLVVDLTEVVFVDAVGEEVLSFFCRLGAEFVAPTSYALDLCERLHLPVARPPHAPQRNSGSLPTNNGHHQRNGPAKDHS